MILSNDQNDIFFFSYAVTVEDGAAAVAINENLFVEDLEGLEEELGDLDLEE